MNADAAAERIDVLVVGAGPAGSMAARRLATSGVRVVLADATRFPRSKPCGDCLSPGATPLLAELGPDIIDTLRQRGASAVRGWRLVPPGAPATPAAQACFGPPCGGVPDWGFALSRRALDAVLLDAACEAGAEFRAPLRIFDLRRSGASATRDRTLVDAPDRILVRARDDRGRVVHLAARWVIGADGLRSVVARRCFGVKRGPRHRLALVGRYAGRRPPADTPGIGVLRVSRDGCLGAARIEHGLWNVTLVVPADRAREISADRFGFYRAELARYGVAPPASAADLATGLEVTGPFEITPTAITAPGVLLTGDAAGYFDPFTGQGIYRALVTGRLAADAVAAALAAPERSAAELSTYEQSVAELFGASRRLQKVIDFAIHRPRLINAVGTLLAARTGLLSLLLDATGDRHRRAHA